MFRRVFKDNPTLLLLLFLWAVICIRNYSLGTYLTGWDTLHPEFNYSLYLERIFSGVWQEHQGLGALATQAHASEIPRLLILFVTDFFVPTSAVRYAYAFLMLLLGPLGVYFLVKRYVLKNIPVHMSEVGGFFAALFYLLNLITVQHFYVPLEMFLTHYGYLGFFLYFAVAFIDSKSARHLVHFAIVAFFMAPQAHTSTLFFSLGLNFIVFLFFLTAASRFSMAVLKRSVFLLFILIVVNAFWLLPNMYFIATSARTVQESKIHRLFNQEAYLQNKAFGNMRELALGKGFLFNWGEHVGNLQYGPLLNEWIYHLDVENTQFLGYIFFTFSVFGLVIAFIKRNHYAFGVLGIFLTSLFFLLNENPPIGFIYIFLQDNLPLFKEAFRFHFTKFSITLALTYAVFFGTFVGYFLSLLQRARLKVALSVTVSSLLFISMCYYMLPIFNGYLISPSMRVTIPERYFQMFEYFNSLDEYGRVADLPIHSFWGWSYYDWNPSTRLGYQGAGFLWFGIKQPLLNREFDRWNITNQNYYADMTRAIYSEDVSLLKETLEKYQVRWILLDKSIVAPGNDQMVLFYENIERLLSSMEDLRLAKDFGGGLLVYEYTPASSYRLKSTGYREDLLLGDGGYVFSALTDASEQLKPEYLKSTTDESLTLGAPVLGEVVSRNNASHLPFTVDVVSDPDTQQYTLRVASTIHAVTGDTVTEILPINLDVVSEYVVELNGQLIYISKNPAPNTVLKTVYLPVSESFEVSTFLLQGDYANINSFLADFDVCSDVDVGSAYTLTRTPGGFALASRNATACLTQSLQDINLNPSSVTNAKPLLEVVTLGQYEEPPCVFNTTTGLCSNILVSNTTSFTVLSDVIADYNLRFYSRNLNPLIEKVSNFDTVNLRVVPAISTDRYSFSDTTISRLQMLSLENGLPLSKETRYGGYVSNGVSQARYCKSGNRYLPEDMDRVSSIVYETYDDEICDSYEYPTASHSTGYLLEIRASNLAGMPLRICLTNEYSKRCDKYIELPKEQDMKPVFYAVPPMGDHSGYTINISNITFAGELSKNVLEYVSLIPIPYDYILNLRDMGSVANTHLNYRNNVLVRYNEAYAPGWIAVCGTRVCPGDHIKVAGWANGWMLPRSVSIEAVKILYWPQSLEYIGLLLLTLVPVSVLIYKKKFND